MDLSGSISDPSSPFNGLPYTYLLPDGNDQTNQRPDVIPGVPLTLPGAGHNGVPLINPAAFQAPPVDAMEILFASAMKLNGMIRALDSWQIDMALTKTTKLTERVAMEFGVQAFNILNHVQLGDPGQFTLSYAPGATPSNLTAPGNLELSARR